MARYEVTFEFAGGASVVRALEAPSDDAAKMRVATAFALDAFDEGQPRGYVLRDPQGESVFQYP